MIASVFFLLAAVAIVSVESLPQPQSRARTVNGVEVFKAEVGIKTSIMYTKGNSKETGPDLVTL